VRPPAEASRAATLALSCLVALAVVGPWAIGAVLPAARLALVLVALAAVAVGLLMGALRGSLTLPAVAAWPLAGYLALALAQLVPLPEPVHRLLAPGSHAVWHPSDPEVARLLGAGARPLSVDPDTTLEALALSAGLALLALVAAPALVRERLAVRAVAAVALSGFALSAYAILARARFGALLYGRIPVPTVAPFGPFVSKNHFAGWCAMAALLTAGLALGLAEAARRRSRDWTTDARAGGVILSLVATLAMALATLASLSRGGVMALVAGCGCLLALRLLDPRRSRAVLLPTLAVTILLGVILVGLVPREAQERMTTLRGAPFRLETWKGALRLAAASPLVGHGLGAFHDAYPRFKRDYGIVRVEHAENDYLETLAETGALGLGLVLAGFGWLLSAGGRGIAEGRDAASRGIGQGALAALAALAVHSGVDFNLRIPSNAALAALAAAIVAAAAGLRPRPLARPVALALAVGVVALAAATLARAPGGWTRARQEVVAAATAQTQAAQHLRLERARTALGAVLRRRPAHAESWLMLGGVEQALGRHATAVAFARHAAWLDPERPGLKDAVAAIEASP
jgi:O-antigen ligase